MREAEKSIELHKKRLLLRDGFLADPELSPRHNLQVVLSKMPSCEYSSLMTNMKYHNLCKELTPPLNVGRLLGLGLSFCLQQYRPDQDIDKTMARLRRDVRRKAFFYGQPEADGDYNPKLYIPSKWEPDETCSDIEEKLNGFEQELKNLQDVSRRRRPCSNMSRAQWSLMKLLKKNDDFMAIPTDKNLGTALIERSYYNKRLWSDHLSDQSTYREVPKCKLAATKTLIQYKLGSLFTRLHKVVPENERIYFSRLRGEFGDKVLGKMYLTAKVHKDPWKTRPIVSTCGTVVHGLSKWADQKLKCYGQFNPSRIKDSFEVKEKLEALGALPPGTRLFTMDAVAMYTNIEPNHGLATIEKLMDLYSSQMPADFPAELVLDVLKFIMRFNVFEAGDTYHHQISGTAMGTPVAVEYATLYYAYHEITVLLAKYSQHLLFYGRFIDDKLGAWNDRDDPGAWERFCADVNNFGILKWDLEQVGREVHFLDLWVSLNADNCIETSTYQKPMNIYQYIPQASAHPLGMGKAMIFGALRRYKLQNTRREDYLQMIRLHFRRMKARGWKPELLKELFLQAADRLELPKPAIAGVLDEEEVKRRDRLFIHMKYHPRGITRCQIRTAFDRICDNFRDTAAEIKQVTIAFSRPKNLRDELVSARLHQPEGRETSTFRPDLSDT